MRVALRHVSCLNFHCLFAIFSLPGSPRVDQHFPASRQLPASARPRPVRTPHHGGGVVLPHPRPLPRGQIGASEGGASALGPRGSGVVGLRPSTPGVYIPTPGGGMGGVRVRDEEKGASALGPRGSGVVGLRPLTPGVYIPTPGWWWGVRGCGCGSSGHCNY